MTIAVLGSTAAVPTSQVRSPKRPITQNLVCNFYHRHTTPTIRSASLRNRRQEFRQINHRWLHRVHVRHRANRSGTRSPRCCITIFTGKMLTQLALSSRVWLERRRLRNCWGGGRGGLYCDLVEENRIGDKGSD